MVFFYAAASECSVHFSQGDFKFFFFFFDASSVSVRKAFSVVALQNDSPWFLHSLEKHGV